MGSMPFPIDRPRRLRRTTAIRNLVRETHLQPSNFVLPLFVVEGEGIRNPIRSMPGNAQLSIDELVEEAASAPSADPCAVGAMEIDAAGLHARIDALRKAAEARFVDGLSAEQRATYDQQIRIHPDCLAVGGGFFFKHVP